MCIFWYKKLSKTPWVINIFTIHSAMCYTSGDACPDNKVHGANMGPTWVLLAPDGSHFGPMNLAIRVCIAQLGHRQLRKWLLTYSVLSHYWTSAGPLSIKPTGTLFSGILFDSIQYTWNCRRWVSSQGICGRCLQTHWSRVTHIRISKLYTSVQLMVWSLFGAKPLSEPNLAYWLSHFGK